MDRYPTDEELERIKTWDYRDFKGLFAFIKSLWWMADWGWREEIDKDIMDRDVQAYKISTGGWSGNESIIDAMQENWMFWANCWQSSRRGGHFVFHLPECERMGQKAQEYENRSHQG